MAQELGITQKGYSKIETGETKLTVDNLFRIASILEVSVGELLNAESLSIYNNYHTHNGEGIVVNKQLTEKTVELYERLIKAQETEIEALKKIVSSLEKKK